MDVKITFTAELNWDVYMYVKRRETGKMVSMLPTFALAFFFPVLLLFVPVRFLLYIPYSPVASCNALGITRRQEGVDECAVIRWGGSRAAIVRSMISRKQVLQVYHREKREKRELDFVHRSPFSGIIGFLRSGNAYEGSQPKLMLHICRMANTI